MASRTWQLLLRSMVHIGDQVYGVKSSDADTDTDTHAGQPPPPLWLGHRLSEQLIRVTFELFLHALLPPSRHPSAAPGSNGSSSAGKARARATVRGRGLGLGPLAKGHTAALWALLGRQFQAWVQKRSHGRGKHLQLIREGWEGWGGGGVVQCSKRAAERAT